jgi:2-polyprenyl-3-methyl-5-hydroxy-6-metoxy-1,4-benzoquinol methylase
MPRRVGAFIPLESLPRAKRVLSDHEFQACWYQHVSPLAVGKSVLDMGAGMGYGRRIMNAAGAMLVECCDLVSLVPWVKVGRIEDYPSSSFDLVVAMDVIEHVEDDVAFLAGMLRVAREAVFFSTPNWNVFHANNVHHRREYTPEELMTLVGSFAGQWTGLSYWGGDEHFSITPREETLPPDDACCNFGVLLRK